MDSIGQQFHLRRLKIDDAPLMLEWMHDESVTADLQTDFASKKLQDARVFIENSQNDTDNLNLAIANDKNEYLGTVSLKHINSKNAEFAITIRSSAMGKGCAIYAMNEIIDIAFKEYGLKYVYWCVDPKNTRAVRFYDKNGFERVDNAFFCGLKWYSEEQIKKFYWYKQAAYA